jgi:hypothetical protein
MSTLFLAVNLLNRTIKEMLVNYEINREQLENADHMIIIGIICLNLASKYEERVAFKISDLQILQELALSQQVNAVMLLHTEFKVL